MLRPQDVIVALYLVRSRKETQTSIANRLSLSQAEISNSLRRLHDAELVFAGGYEPIRQNLFAFCVHGVRFVFAAETGRPQRGVGTACLAPPLLGHVRGDDGEFVWPSPDGTERGPSLAPLHPCAVTASLGSPPLHRKLALVDAIRVGNERTRSAAVKGLAKEMGVG